MPHHRESGSCPGLELTQLNPWRMNFVRIKRLIKGIADTISVISRAISQCIC